MSSTLLLRDFYYVSFIDDTSKKTWIYFMKTKDEVFNRFQEFKAIVEKQRGEKMKVLRYYNGGEYTFKSLNPLLISKDQEGVDNPFHPTIEWNCKKKEWVHC